METAPNNYAGNIEAAFVRLEGKIDRLVDTMGHEREETVRLRDRVHEIANHISPLVLLDIPAKLTGHEGRIAALESEREQRKGAMAVMRAIWAVIGFVGAGAVFGIVKALGGGI